MKFKQFKKHLTNVNLDIPDVSKSIKDMAVPPEQNFSKNYFKGNSYRRTHLIKGMCFVIVFLAFLVLILSPSEDNRYSDILLPNQYPGFIAGEISPDQCPDEYENPGAQELPTESVESSLDSATITKIKKVYYQNIIEEGLGISSASDPLLIAINSVLGEDNSMIIDYYNNLSPVVLSSASVNSIYNQYKTNNGVLSDEIKNSSITNHQNSSIVLSEGEYEVLLDIFLEEENNN